MIWYAYSMYILFAIVCYNAVLKITKRSFLNFFLEKWKLVFKP